MDSEIGRIDMADIDAMSFTWVVDSAIRSRSPSNSGESSLHSFASIVDSLIMSPVRNVLSDSVSRDHDVDDRDVGAESFTSQHTIIALEKMLEVQIWREALTRMASLSVWDVQATICRD